MEQEEWQEAYAKRIQTFFKSKGLNSFEDQFNTDGSRPAFILKAGTDFQRLRHSIGLISTVTTTNFMHKDFDYIHKLWNEKLQPYDDGYFDPYYDGLLYLFSLMHLSAKYQLITPSIQD